MIVDAVDATGRRYMRATSEVSAEACVECGATIEVGAAFYMRNDAADGSEPGLMGALMAFTYDAVCYACGESQLRKDAG